MPTLNWIGKEAVENHHKDVPFRLLKCNEDLSVGAADSENMLIEGDNLIALKALLPYYKGKVKCIYIDPPYNTGNENWIYNDNVNSLQIRNWLGKVVGSDDLSRHDKWLCMMYPRLVLLREMLSDDGVIFVSIDDNEQHHLRMMMDEIFGENHFLAIFVWKKRSGANDAKDYVSIDHECVLTYRKTEKFRFSGVKKSFKNYSNPDNDPRGPWTLGDLTCGKTSKERPNLFYDITDPKTNILYKCNPDHVWRFTRENMERLIAEGKVVFPKSGKGNPQYKRHLSEVRSDTKPVSTWIEPSITKKSKIRSDSKDYEISILQTTINAQATKQLRQIFGSKIFNNPKPIDLIQELVNQASNKNAIILDAFAGSGTTGHAVLELNKKDSGNRRFILIEIEPEICRNVTVERLKRVINGYTYQDYRKQMKFEYGLGGGFRYYELGEMIFNANGQIREDVSFEDLGRHVFFTETNTPLPQDAVIESPLLGVHDGIAVYLLHDRELTRSALQSLPSHDGAKMIFATSCHLSQNMLRDYNITFRQIPYDVKVS